MKTIIRSLVIVVLCIVAATGHGKGLDISETITLERYTLIDGSTFRYEQGFLLKSGQFRVITSDIEYYSFFGLSTDDIAPMSGKPVMNESLYNSYHTLGVIPKWVASRADFTIGFVTYVIVAVSGKGDPNPTITIFTQPESDRELVGDSAFLEVDAEPWDDLTYQWYFKKKPIPGATESWLLLSNLTAAQGGLYSVALSTGGKPVMSKSALLTIVQPVYVKKQPKSIVVKAGKKATFTVSAGGTPPYTYQWLSNGVPIMNATKSFYTIAKVQASAAVYYSVSVDNGPSFALSHIATLSVTP